jgi:hypothetical protein
LPLSPVKQVFSPYSENISKLHCYKLTLLILLYNLEVLRPVKYSPMEAICSLFHFVLAQAIRLRLLEYMGMKLSFITCSGK